MITINQLVETRHNSIKNRIEELDKEFVECKTAMFAGKEIQDNFRRIELIKLEYERLNATSKSNTDTAIKNAWTLFNHMSNILQAELNASVTDDKIRFKWEGKSLSFIVELLAKYFDLTTGAFSFKSSFSTHEAYTAEGYMIHISIDDQKPDTVLIDFGFEKLYKSYLQN